VSRNELMDLIDKRADEAVEFLRLNGVTLDDEDRCLLWNCMSGLLADVGAWKPERGE
jgi:hypothetical protein